MQGILYANITALELRGALDGGEYSFPKVVAGSHLSLKLRLSQDLEGEPADVRRTVHAIKASLGRADARPLGGGFQLKLGDAAESAGVNVTVPLAYNCTAAQLESAINGLSGVPDLRPCKVQFAEGSFEIRFADDSAPVEIVCVDNDLWPVSFVNASAVAFDEGSPTNLGWCSLL
ncbi:hypothetical protein [Verrucomicrobium spinosum]|uniref:hypothetical protein n=1 Tax=Verrucomicrobium spinosum TaxID=2736 RepID=UPI0009465FB8|nr:hypothetical protein [Verrucomicrobium spinosum]